VVVVLLDETGSVVWEVTSAEFTIVVPAAVPPLTVTTKAKLPDVVLLFKLALAEQSTSPVPPGAGAVPHVHPAGGAMEVKVVLGGVCW
jgi:hypothetical protein